MSRSEPDERTERQVARRNDPSVQRSASQYRAPEADNIIRRVIEIIDTSPGLPMSASVRVNKEEVVAMLSDALSLLPEELRTARWLLKEREEFLAKQHREGEEMIAAAAARVARMADRQAVVKAAEVKAAQIIEDAEDASRRLQRETEDFCDQRLASFENTLAKIQKTVSIGRKRLAAPTIEEAELGSGPSGGPGQATATGNRGDAHRGEGRVEGRPASRAGANDPSSDIFDQDQ
ncbi:MAG TPA: hypothetical protein VL068_04805 [Microthrixaceae bacterium]|nr:hypothetical protein [Microthrixaceae bacterium]